MESTLVSPQRTDRPTVVHLKRKDGVVVQDCDVYIGRAMNMGGWRLLASKWQNPFKLKDYPSAQVVCEKYEEYLRRSPDLMRALPELRGKRLGCWCKPAPCHGDVLVKLYCEYVGQ